MDLIDDVELCLANNAGLYFAQRINGVKPGIQKFVLGDLLRALSQHASLSACDTPNFVGIDERLHEVSTRRQGFVNLITEVDNISLKLCLLVLFFFSRHFCVRMQDVYLHGV